MDPPKGDSTLDVPGLDDTLDVDLRLIPTSGGNGLGAKLLKRGLNYFHEALADYLLINPGATLKEISTYFGYTPSWICQVINNDMFQAYLSDRRQALNVSVAQSLPEKMKDADHLAVERLAKIVAETTDEKVAVDAADKILHRFGYAPNAKTGAQQQGGVFNQQNNFYLAPGDLAAAREKLVEVHNAETVQGGAGSAPSEVPALPATVHKEEKE